MGQAISIAEQQSKQQGCKERPELSNKSTPGFSTKSRSSSSNSLSRMTTSSQMSQQSTTSMSSRFISYEDINEILYIHPKNNRHQDAEWKLKLVPKYLNHSIYDQESQQQSEQKGYIVFGICESALLDQGYKHRYYGYGYSITYCHGYSFHSYSTPFPINTPITIKYNHRNRQISFWCNKIKKERIINIQSHPVNAHVITMKSYNDNYGIQFIQ